MGSETNELVQLWEGMRFVKEHVYVIVSSSDGWCWVLAWIQVGLHDLVCRPLNEKAKQQLEQLRQHPVFERKIKEDEQDKSTNKIVIQCIHISSVTSLDEILRQTPSLFHSKVPDQYFFISHPPISKLQNAIRSKLPSTFNWQPVRHTALGGLTTARLVVGWSHPAAVRLQIGQDRPIRPFGRFLEPAARCIQWRASEPDRSDCWYPHLSNATAYPWPWIQSPQWVDTSSVFFGTNIQRRFTDKEKCQLFDLKYEWRGILTSLMEWEQGCVAPLRMMVEVIVAFGTPLREILTDEKQSKTKVNVLDWGRERPPWIGQGTHFDIREFGDHPKYFGWHWDSDELNDVAVACKGDDASVDLSLWAVGGESPAMEKARAVIRTFLWREWYRRIQNEANSWLRNNDSPENRNAIEDCLERCKRSDWWSWDHGSRLFFWRWPLQWQVEARDGSMGFHTRKPQPRLQFPQVPITEDWVKEKDLEKLEKLLRRGYIVRGHCVTTVPRFPVPKGSDDIRVVWDLAKNGVNETMYTPTFFLATLPTYLRRISSGSYGGDFDIGEQFHNYILHQNEQPYCGVVIPEELRLRLQTEGIPTDKYMRWGRLVFGWQSSPYMALRMFSRAIEIAKGSPTDKSSAFAWDDVRLNLPGSTFYDPGQPRVIKLTSQGLPVSDLVSFYDDGRVFGPTYEAAHSALRQITSRLQWLGNQDAARKRRAVSQRPGAWAGGVVHSDQNLLRAFVALPKWEKAKTFLDWVWNCINKNTKTLERSTFRSGKGFLVHMSTCYEFIQPYLKGFHLSEDAWRSDRDPEGWKIQRRESPDEDDEHLDIPTYGCDLDGNNLLPITHKSSHEGAYEKAPTYIKPVPRLHEDVRILRTFFQPQSPLQIIIRPVEGSTLVVYGGGDASGEGFGAHVQPIGMKPLLRRGFWCPSDADQSSNWREFRNLLDVIRIEANSGRLMGREIWLATDNSTAANAYHKGSSKSKLLHEMVTELRMLTITGNFILRLYHVAGTRMIESGIDGLSRGELHVDELERAMQTLMPLNESPLERSPSLKHWLDSWLDPNYRVATPKDWFYNAHQAGTNSLDTQSETWVWDLAPAAAIHAIEELGNARLKRHETLRGVVIIPTLLSPEWFRRFSRVVDFYFTIPPGSIDFWPNNMHESLTVGLYLPLFRHQPWDWKRVPFLVPLGVSLSAMYKTGDADAGDILREFWGACPRVTEMPKRLVCDLLQNPSWRRFLRASNEGR